MFSKTLEANSFRLLNHRNKSEYLSISNDFKLIIEKFDIGDSDIFLTNQRINDIQFINNYLDEVYNSLDESSFYLGYFETFTAHKQRKKINRYPILRTIYFFFDFLINRVLPKTKALNKIHFFITKGKNKLLSKAEVLGRLVYAGFEILQVESFNGITYFKVKKNQSKPERKNVSYGLIFKMPRIGKNGKLFNIYKLRTMHPYSEYIQDYVMNQQGFGRNGKLENDFRITPWGKWMRKYWIDELPQIFNLLKGEMKIVGIRPVSQSYFNILPKEIQEKRIKFKPACIPPYVSLNFKSSVKDVIEAENIYMDTKLKHPYTTDSLYLIKALINIIFKGKRSA